MGCRLSWLTQMQASVGHDGCTESLAPPSQKALPPFPPKPAAPRSQIASSYHGVVPGVVVVVVVVCVRGGDGRDARAPLSLVGRDARGGP